MILDALIFLALVALMFAPGDRRRPAVGDGVCLAVDAE